MIGWVLPCGHLVAVIQIWLHFSSVMASRDGRGAIESALQRLRLDLPALPQLRDFQVAEASLIYDSSCLLCPHLPPPPLLGASHPHPRDGKVVN